MGFSFPLLQKKKGGAVLVLSIDEGALRFILFEEIQGELRVLTHGKREAHLSNLEQNLVGLLAELTKTKSLSQLIVSFSSDIYKAQIVTETIRRGTLKHTIDKKEALSLEEKMYIKAKRNFHTALFEDSGILPADFEFRTMRILSRRVDGYEVQELQGFKGGDVESTILGTFLLRKPLILVKRAAQKYSIQNIAVVHIAEAIAQYSEKTARDGVFLFIEQRRTQIVVARQGVFAFLNPISMGEENFNYVFSEALGMKENIASEFQEQYFRGELSEALMNKVRTLLLPEVRNFGTLVTKQLDGASISLPENVWIFGNGSNIGDIAGLFEKDTQEDLPFSALPQVDFLLPHHIREVKNFPGFDNPHYTGLFLFYEAKTH